MNAKKQEMYDKLLDEAASCLEQDLMKLDDSDNLNEDATDITFLAINVAAVAAYFAIMIAITFKRRNAGKKEAAANAYSVTVEDYNSAVKLLNDHVSDMEDTCKKKLKDYVDADAITFYKNNLNFISTKNKNSHFMAGDPVYLDCGFAKISYRKAAKAAGRFQEMMVTSDNYKDYIKKETARIKDVILGSFKKICAGNEFLKTQCFIYVENRGSYGVLYIGTDLIIRADSKLLK